MSKAVVLATTTAFILLIICFQKIKTNHKDYGPRGLSRRLGFKILPPLFDPLIVKTEKLIEEKGLDHRETSSLANHELSTKDMDKYSSDKGRLNITLRLIYLFPFLDNAPKDGFVECNELKAWIMQQATDRMNYRTQKDLALHDKDGDEAISFQEYIPQFSIQDLGKIIFLMFLFHITSFGCLKNGGKKKENWNLQLVWRRGGEGIGDGKPERVMTIGVSSTARNEMGHGEAGWWKEQFKNADIDLNGILNFYEFRDFLHPEDSNNEQIHKWLLREKLKPIDYDHDEKLSFLEFKNGIYDIYKNYVEFENGGANVPYPEAVFVELDVNEDKLLRVEELKPLFHYLSPGELSYAKYYAIYLIQEADDNEDGKLTLDEMIWHENIFYNSVYEDGIFDDDDDLHEEL
ncbi:Calumenin [Camellia lanceoleosa]|uniref:Calumenin n=1 Tax=Camellia lanceoleosa TaxID=1840588 RepID=A0ACC0IWT9_9ERIC|nr:Calumenin [Camellia lanceoleosa]